MPGAGAQASSPPVLARASKSIVAPVATEEDRRRVYLPEGAWTDWWTRRRLAGGRWLEVEAGPETLPLYVREGGLVPMGPVMNYVGEKALDRVDLLVALFERDGTSRLDVPVNGSWVPVEYTRAAGRHTVSIGASPVPFEVEALGQGEVEVRSG